METSRKNEIKNQLVSGILFNQVQAVEQENADLMGKLTQNFNYELPWVAGEIYKNNLFIQEVGKLIDFLNGDRSIEDTVEILTKEIETRKNKLLDFYFDEQGMRLEMKLWEHKFSRSFLKTLEEVKASLEAVEKLK